MMFESSMRIDICLTYRCNGSCINCIKMCNREKDTGIDYSDSDMTMGQIDNFIYQMKSLGAERKPVFDRIKLTGGEPLLHPNFTEIAFRLKELYREGYMKHFIINSNLIIGIHRKLKWQLKNYSTIEEKRQIHKTNLLHPSEFVSRIHTYNNCSLERRTKHTLVLSYNGYSVCCAADGYIRLFGMEDLFFDSLPTSIKDYPSEKMDNICKHCPFGSTTIMPYEKDLGAPVSEIYRIEADKNRLGRKITKRFPELR